MSEENSNQPVDINDDNQAAFEDLFFNGEPVQEDDPVDQEEAPSEDVEDEVVDLGEDDDPPAPEEDDEDEDEPEEEEKPKGKNRKSFQERINELTAKARAEEREKIALLKRLEDLEAVVKKETVKDQKPLREQLPSGAPKPDAKGEDGEPLYPLGEFDPNYIADLTQFTVDERIKAAEEKKAQEDQAREYQEYQNAVRDHWVEKVAEAEETIPEIRDSIQELTETFSDVDGAYGEYLATTIMSSDFGPQIMHYLSQNIGEAQKIVASGPAAATLALGRLEARFELNSTKQEEQKRNKKVTNAQEPPEDRTRGVHGQFAVRPDTDNQRAFEKEFFKDGFF